MIQIKLNTNTCHVQINDKCRQEMNQSVLVLYSNNNVLLCLILLVLDISAMYDVCAKVHGYALCPQWLIT